MEIPENLKEIGLSQSEVDIFGKIARMEEVHNELARHLTLYKEEIVSFRNSFVASVCAKYRIENPKEWRFDNNKEKLVSAFNPTVQVWKHPMAPMVFQETAKKEMMKLILDLAKILRTNPSAK